MAEGVHTTEFWEVIGRPPAQAVNIDYQLDELHTLNLQHMLRHGADRHFDAESLMIANLADERFSGVDAGELIARYLEIAVYVDSLGHRAKTAPGKVLQINYLPLEAQRKKEQRTTPSDEEAALYSRVLNDVYFALEDEAAFRLVGVLHIDDEFVNGIKALLERLQSQKDTILFGGMLYPTNLLSRRLDGLIRKIEVYRRIEEKVGEIEKRAGGSDRLNTNVDGIAAAADDMWMQIQTDQAYPIPRCYCESDILPEGTYFHLTTGVEIPAALRRTFERYTSNVFCHIGFGPKPVRSVRINAKEQASADDAPLVMFVTFDNEVVPMCTVDRQGEIHTLLGITSLRRFFELQGKRGTYELIRLTTFTYLHEITQAAVPVERQRASKPRRVREFIDTLSAGGDPGEVARKLKLIVPRTELVDTGTLQTERSPIEVTVRRAGRIYTYNIYPRHLPEGWHRSSTMEKLATKLGVEQDERFKARGFTLSDPRWTVYAPQATLEALDLPLEVVRHPVSERGHRHPRK